MGDTRESRIRALRSTSGHRIALRTAKAFLKKDAGIQRIILFIAELIRQCDLLDQKARALQLRYQEQKGANPKN
jgi:hypothetical protein